LTRSTNRLQVQFHQPIPTPFPPNTPDSIENTTNHITLQSTNNNIPGFFSNSTFSVHFSLVDIT